jgi:hypothetical protein
MQVCASEQRAEIDQGVEDHQRCSHGKRQEWSDERPSENEHGMLLVTWVVTKEQRGESGVALIREKRPDVSLTEWGDRGHLSRFALCGALRMTEG